MTNSETKKFSQNVSSSYHLGGKCSGEYKKDSPNVPKLRFKGYNEEWKRVKIGEIYKERSERGNTNAELLSVTMNDGVKRRIDIEGKDISSENKSNYKSVYIGDMVYNSMRMWQGANGISNYDGIVSPAYTVMFPKTKLCNNFIGYLFKYEPLIFLFRRYSQGLTSDTWNLKYPQIKQLPISIPSLPEQEKIAAFLILIDKKIEKQKELVELLKKYKRGLLSQIFSHKLRFKDENGNNYPEWEEKRLGDICTIIGGGTPDTNNAKYWGNDINWFTPTEIIKKYIDCSNRKISKLGLLKSSAKILPIGTVLLTTRATLGEMSILQIEATTNQGFQSLIPNKNLVTSEFIYYCQPIIKYYCYKYANGSTFLEISKQSLAKLKLKIPYLNEQNKISEFLSKFDDKIQQEKYILNYLQAYKKGLLQQMFI